MTARNILSGQIEVPPWASMLIQCIERKIGTELDSKWVDDAPSDVDEASGRSRGYSFGTEFASQGSEHAENEGRERDRPRDRGLSQSTRERLHEASAAEKGGVMGVGNRLRGYSLGSFGRSKSGSSTPSREAAYNGRDRANSAADPKYRYRGDESDKDEEYFDNGGRSRFSGGMDARQSVSRQSQYSFNDDQDIPPSPSSIGSASSRTQRFTEFMKRPVLPARKSTSALSTVSRPGGERSPYSGGSGAHSPTNSRARSGTLGSFRNKDNAGGSRRKGRLEFSGKYSSSDDETNNARPDRRRLSASDKEERDDQDTGSARNSDLATASPFADRFGKEVEHRFSDEEEGDDDRFGSGGKLGKRGNRSRSGTGGFSGGDDRPTRPTFGKKQSSTGKLLSGASEAMKGTTSAMKGVFSSRPMSKRSSTAPMPRREPSGRERSDSWRDKYGGADGDRYGRGSDDEYEGYNATRAGDELDDIIVRSGSRSRDVTSTEGSGTEDDGHRRGDIRIKRADNPFAESSSKKGKSRSAAAYDSDDVGADSQAESGALFSSSRENRDILSALDDDVSASPLAAARPQHRLGAEDNASLRSFDSSRDDIVQFGNRAVRIRQVEDDFTDQLQTQGVPRFMKTDTRSNSYTRAAGNGKELRLATFDFDGSEVRVCSVFVLSVRVVLMCLVAQPGDLPFVVGDIIEVLAKGDPDWWTGRLKMREGIIPVNRTKAYNP